MKLKKKEDQNVGTSVFLRRVNKLLIGGNMETKCGAETEGKAIQRLPHLGIHPVYNHKHFCGCQQVLADRSLLSPKRLHQCLTNAEVDAHSLPLD